MTEKKDTGNTLAKKKKEKRRKKREERGRPRKGAATKDYGGGENRITKRGRKKKSGRTIAVRPTGDGERYAAAPPALS
ncbi:MAG: hypothetical protein PVS2B2_16070 [Candidatus Acidiferrum sp.]